jgi:hypothetical protein
VQALCADESVKKEVQMRIETSGRASGMKGFEIVKKIHFSAELFSVVRSSNSSPHNL